MSEEKQNIVVLGAGESGVGAAILAKIKGFDVFLSDKGKISKKYKTQLEKYAIQWEEDRHSENKILSAKEIIKSPGIPQKTPLILKIKKAKIPIISEIEFAARYTNAYSIGITGSNGKTTTTLLIFDLLKRAGLNVGLAGNIGKSFALQVALNQYDYYVLELSSFQLENMYNFKANIAIILNITPDHLDQYNYDFDKYAEAKLRIIQNQTKNEQLIFCADDEVLVNKLKIMKPDMELLPFSMYQETENGAYTKNENLIINHHKNNFDMLINELALQGKHNTYNSMAAGLAASVLKIKKEYIRESLSNFKGVEHRLEPVIKVHKIEFINDSKATNINATWYALESMKNYVVWIAGGIDKGNDYEMLMPIVEKKVKALICLGTDNKNLHKAFDGKVKTIVDALSMEEAVKAAYLLANNGDTVLLSPACASFDLFENYEDRGRKFKEAVRNL